MGVFFSNFFRCILRKKIWRTPTTVYGDDEETIDTSLTYINKNWEMYLQLLDRDNVDDVDRKYRGADTTIFVRRWRPSSYTLEEFIDVPLRAITQLELAEKLSTISQLPAERMEIAKAAGTFPCQGSVLSIHDDLTWLPVHDSSESSSPCCVQNDGDVIYWRDRSEPLKKLSEVERKEIWVKENGDSASSDTASAYSSVPCSSSPRKERPLRILLDTPTPTVPKPDIELD